MCIITILVHPHELHYDTALSHRYNLYAHDIFSRGVWDELSSRFPFSFFSDSCVLVYEYDVVFVVLQAQTTL